MNLTERQNPPPLPGPSRARRLRVLVIRGLIAVLAIVAVTLAWQPWTGWDDCLRCASRNGHFYVAYYYLLRGEDVNEPGQWGYTALMEAARAGHLTLVDLLVRHGAKLEAADEDGNTALIWAAVRGHDPIVTYLIRHGAKLNRQDVHGNTAPMLAVRNYHPATMRYLLEAGADINLTNHEGEAVLQKAAQLGYGDVVRLLKRHGAANTNLFIGPSPYPTKPLSPQRLWALATNALNVQANGDSHELLGSRPASARTWAQNSLRDGWNITSRVEARQTLDWLWQTGHRGEYSVQVRRPPSSRSPARPFLAWDYCRLVSIAGVSAVAGYLTEDEAWARIMPAARAIQANYSSWKEMGEDYLLGRQLKHGRRDPDVDYVFRLLTNPNDPTSPWNKNLWSLDLTEPGTAAGPRSPAEAP